MKTQMIEYDDGETKARIVVSTATIMQGQKRSRLSFEAGKIDDPDLSIMHGFIYPALIAASQSIEINGVSGDPFFEVFAHLPDALGQQWTEAVFDLNPHWLPQDADEKKANS